MPSRLDYRGLVQLFGILAGSAPVIDDVANYGLFFLLVDPDVLMTADDFKARVSAFRQTISSSRPIEGTSRVRVPGDASLQRRNTALAAGVVNLDERVYRRIVELCEKK